jgi:transcriptional regulator with XRE-family HTH domain
MDPRVPEVLNLVGNIKYYYKRKGMTASGLSKAAGLDPSFLNKIERDSKGWSDMRLSSIAAIANTLDISITQLLYREDFEDKKVMSVPVIPTEEMLEAGEMAMTCIPPWPTQEVEGVWKAMLGRVNET